MFIQYHPDVYIRMVLYRAKFLQVCKFELFVRAKNFDHSFHILTAR